MCVCVCVCVCMCIIYIHAYIHTYIIHTYIHDTSICTYIHMYIHMLYIHMYIHTYIGCLGHGDREDRLKPVMLLALSRVRIVRVVGGKSNPLALSEDGKLYTWGRGKFGAHGHGHTAHVLEPKLMALPEDRIVVGMDSGRHHCAMLTIKGEVWCWGCGQGFALGNGREEDSCVPVRVESIRKFVIVQVSCGGNRTAALARGGNLYMWGGGTTVSGMP